MGVTGDGGTGDSTDTSGGGRFRAFSLCGRGVKSKEVLMAVAGGEGRLNDALEAGAEGGGKCGA